jgi:hypothetical protein
VTGRVICKKKKKYSSVFFNLCFLFLRVKIKVKERKSCPCALTKHHAMKAYRGSGGIAPLIL